MCLYPNLSPNFGALQKLYEVLVIHVMGSQSPVVIPDGFKEVYVMQHIVLLGDSIFDNGAYCRCPTYELRKEEKLPISCI